MGVMILVAVAAFLVVIGFWAHRRGEAQKQAWEASAAALGLGFSPGPHSDRPIRATHHMPQMYGQHDGQDVYVGVRRYSTGSGKNRTTHYRTFVDVVFDVPLKRGFSIARADSVSKFFGTVFGQRDIPIGEEPFDRDFRIKGNDSDQVVALLRDPDLRALLTGDFGAFAPDVNDQRARLEATGVVVDSAALTPQLEPAVQLYRRMLAAWEALPPSAEERRVAPVWEPVAARCELRYQARGMVARGRFGPVSLRAETALTTDGWHTVVEAQLEPPLGARLKLSHEGALSGLGKLFGAQDVAFDDEAFDRLFVVKAADVDKVTRILVPEARERLTRLRDVADEVAATDDAVTVTIARIVDEVELLVRVVTMVRDAAEAMVGFRRPEPHGPFR